MKTTRQHGQIRALLIGSLFSLVVPHTAAASSAHISLIVPYAGGGTNDALARLLAEGMSQELGRTIIVENKPGANGIIGASYVARAKPDGNTLLLGGTGPISLNPLLRPTINYGVDSFDSVALLFDGPLTVTIPSSLPATKLEDLKTYAEKQNRPLLYGTLGPGSVTDLFGLILSKTLELPLTAVAYKNNPSSLMDLISGRSDLSYATPSALAEYVKDNKIKILAITTEERNPYFPEIPSVTELGYPELKSSFWTSLHVPKGTPVEVIDKLTNAAKKTIQTEKFKELLATSGQNLKAGGPKELDEQIKADQQHWGSIIKEHNIVIN